MGGSCYSNGAARALTLFSFPPSRPNRLYFDGTGGPEGGIWTGLVGDIKLLGLFEVVSIGLQMISTALMSPWFPPFATFTSHTAPFHPKNPEACKKKTDIRNILAKTDMTLYLRRVDGAS